MAMAVASDHSFALTVSADHIVGRYDLVRCAFLRGTGLRCVKEHVDTGRSGTIHACVQNKASREWCYRHP